MSSLDKKTARLPREPGVYIMKDRRGAVLYVGKAKNLRSRVRSYFGAGAAGDPRLARWVARVADVDALVTTSEKEALILENSLIKQQRPRYNVRLRDEKTYLSLRLDRRHPWPRFTLVRRTRRDRARYFGPFDSAQAARQTLKSIYRTFGIRSCSDAVFSNRTRPCLYYQIGQCLAPCVGFVGEQEYAKALDGAELLLDGRNRELLAGLRGEMAEHAEAERFEQAARLRDRIRAIERTIQKQSIEMPGSEKNFDVLGHHRLGDSCTLQWLSVRGGRVVDSQTTEARVHVDQPSERVLRSVLLQHYDEGRPLPGEVVVDHEIEDRELVAEVLSDRRGGRVDVRVLGRGLRRRLAEMATTNARLSAETRLQRGELNLKLLEQTRAALALGRLPRRVDCFDISNIQGRLAVGAMAVLRDGAPAPDLYRHYRIKSLDSADDYGMLREVLSRRLARGQDSGDLPDLIAVDGGRGQVNIAASVAEELGLGHLDIIGIAKAPGRRPGRETVWSAARDDPIELGGTDPVLQLLLRVRDEAHRFALGYHRKLRQRRDLASELTTIDGLGPKRARALLRHFGSVAAIREASLERLAEVPGVSRKLAERVHAGLTGATKTADGR